MSENGHTYCFDSSFVYGIWQSSQKLNWVFVLFFNCYYGYLSRQYWLEFLNVPTQHSNSSNLLNILAEIFLSARMALDLTSLPCGLQQASHYVLSLWRKWSFLRFQATWLSSDLSYPRKFKNSYGFIVYWTFSC